MSLNNSDLFSEEYKPRDSDFIVEGISDLITPRKEEDYFYNLSFLKSKLIKGILSTEGNLASIDDIDLLTTRTFSSFEFSRNLSENDIQEVWAMNKCIEYLENNFMYPITREIIEEYNKLVVVGPKSRVSGRIRETNVFINGSSYSTPDFSMLGRLFDNMISEISLVNGEINKAFSFILGISKLQLFIDGNKRTSLLVALHHLCYSGQPLLVMKNDFSQQYLKSLKYFYETSDNSKVVAVLIDQLDINH